MREFDAEDCDDYISFTSPGAVEAITESLRYTVEVLPVDTPAHEAVAILADEGKQVLEANREDYFDDRRCIAFPYDTDHGRTDLFLFATRVYETWLRSGPQDWKVMSGYNEMPLNTGESDRVTRVSGVRLTFPPLDEHTRIVHSETARRLVTASVTEAISNSEQ